MRRRKKRVRVSTFHGGVEVFEELVEAIRESQIAGELEEILVGIRCWDDIEHGQVREDHNDQLWRKLKELHRHVCSLLNSDHILLVERFDSQAETCDSQNKRAC